MIKLNKLSEFKSLIDASKALNKSGVKMIAIEFLDRLDKDHHQYKNAQLMLNGWGNKTFKGIMFKIKIGRIEL